MSSSAELREFQAGRGRARGHEAAELKRAASVGDWTVNPSWPHNMLGGQVGIRRRVRAVLSGFCHDGLGLLVLRS